MSQTIYEIIHDLVIDGPKPAKQLATDVGKEHNTLLREVNPNDPGAKVGIELLVPLMNATGSLEPLRWLAEQMGQLIIPMPRADAGNAELQARALIAVQEFGDVFRSFNAALADGMVTQAEYEDFKRELLEVVAVLMAWLDQMQTSVHDREQLAQ